MLANSVFPVILSLGCFEAHGGSTFFMNPAKGWKCSNKIRAHESAKEVLRHELQGPEFTENLISFSSCNVKLEGKLFKPVAA